MSREPKYSFPRKGSPEGKALLRRYVTENKTKLAQEMGYAGSDSLYHAFNKAYGYTKADKLAILAGVVEDMEGSDLAEKIASDKESMRQKLEDSFHKRAYNQLLKETSFYEVIESAVRDGLAMIPPITIKVVAPTPQKEIKDTGSETDVIIIGDLHAGEVVDPKQTFGLSQYNMTIMNRRLYRLFAKIKELVDLRRKSVYIPKLILPHIGDMLSGEIHLELIKTNADNMMNLVVRTASMLAQGIHQLAPHFDEIFIPCVPGNHARFDQQPYFKDKYACWDTLVYQIEAGLCYDLKNVTFDIPKSPFTIFNAEKTRILMTHGDSIKSWQQIAHYGIGRAKDRLRTALQLTNERFDSFMLGHFHVASIIDDVTGPIIINGSVKGGDEFSLGAMQTASKPQQNMLYFHDKHGFIGYNPIYLSGADDREGEEFFDHIPDVWWDIKKSMV